MKIGTLAAIAAAGVTGLLAASAWAQSLPLPSGSYSRTCTDARALSQSGGRLLIARCQKAAGGYESTSLRYETCRGDIGNNNGRLFCNTSNGGGDRPPSGSYTQTCSNIDMRGAILSALCRDGRGNQNRTQLDTRDCRGRDIANINGRLNCSTGAGDGGGGGAVPTGSYQRTCRNAYMNGSVLHATCKLTFGNSTKRTSIETRQCRNRDIANVNGQLTCANNGNPNQPGPVRGVITLYSQLGYAGRSAVIDRPAASLGAWQMADKARSLQVRSGRWQLCSEPNFRGRCVTVDRNQRDLRTLGLDGQISSVQPVR